MELRNIVISLFVDYNVSVALEISFFGWSIVSVCAWQINAAADMVFCVMP